MDSSTNTLSAFGEYIRSQRRLAQLTLRDLADLTRVSNPYLSQIERGLHQPSVAVIKSLAQALNLSVESLLAQAAGIDDQDESELDTEAAIRADKRLSAEQKEALLTVYRGFVGAGNGEPARPRARAAPKAKPRPAKAQPAKNRRK